MPSSTITAAAPEEDLVYANQDEKVLKKEGGKHGVGAARDGPPHADAAEEKKKKKSSSMSTGWQDEEAEGAKTKRVKKSAAPHEEDGKGMSLVVVKPEETSEAIAESLRAKMNEFVAGWQSVESMAQQRLMAGLKMATDAADNAMYTAVLALCLGPITLASMGHHPNGAQASSGDNGDGDTASMMDGVTEAADLNKSGGDNDTRCVRVSFLILKVLNAGWSSVMPADAGGGAAASKQKGGKRGGGYGGGYSGGARGAPKEKFARILRNANGGNTEHVMIHSFGLVNKGKMVNRGERTDEYLVLSPGMVLTLRVWGEKIQKVFSQQHTDVAAFDLATLQVSTKSHGCKSQDALLDLRTFATVPGLSAAAHQLVRPSLLASSIEEACVRRTHFQDATHIAGAALPQSALSTSSTGAGNDAASGSGAPPPTVPLPEGLSQTWIHGNLSNTLHVVRVVPTTGTFAIGPDDVLRFHGGEQPLADLPCNTMAVSFDTKQFPSGDREGLAWTVRLFNAAVLLGAAELLVLVDMYRGRDESREPNQTGFVRLDLAPLTTYLLRHTHHRSSGGAQRCIDDEQQAIATVGPIVPPPKQVAAAFEAQGMKTAVKHLAVYPITSTTMAVPSQPLIANGGEGDAHVNGDTTMALVPTTGTANNGRLLSPGRQQPSSLAQRKYVVIDMRRLQKRAPDPTAAGVNGAAPQQQQPQPMLLSPFAAPQGAWERGHNVHVFVNGQMVFHFIAPIHTQGTELLSQRVFDAMPIPKPEDLGAVYEEEEEEEETVVQAPIATPPKAVKPKKEKEEKDEDHHHHHQAPVVAEEEEEELREEEQDATTVGAEEGADAGATTMMDAVGTEVKNEGGEEGEPQEAAVAAPSSSGKSHGKRKRTAGSSKTVPNGGDAQ